MDEPDYGSLSLDELLDIERRIDKRAYPGRYAEIARQIDLRKSGVGPRDDMADLASEASAEAPKTPGAQPLFTGSAGEYFRIWIVNLLLSLITLGIYSAWATVRNRRYLYGNIELDGSRFDFHGNPVAILRGRILAVTLFAAYAFGGRFHYAIPLVAICVLIVGFPWIMVTALRFRLSNTSWKSLRFGFGATVRQGYRAFAAPAIVALAAYILLLGISVASGGGLEQINLLAFGAWLLGMLLLMLWLAPSISYRARELAFSNICYGDHRFTTEIDSRVFYSAFFKALGLGILAALVAIIIVTAMTVAISPLLQAGGKSFAVTVTMVTSYAMLLLVYLLPFALWRVRTTNHVVSAVRIENTSFRMSMHVFDYWFVLVSNAVVAVLSIGIAIPWTKIRMLRYRLSCLRVVGDLGGFTGAIQGSRSATGDQIGDAFDFDFGF